MINEIDLSARAQIGTWSRTGSCFLISPDYGDKVEGGNWLRVLLVSLGSDGFGFF